MNKVPFIRQNNIYAQLKYYNQIQLLLSLDKISLRDKDILKLTTASSLPKVAGIF